MHSWSGAMRMPLGFTRSCHLCASQAHAALASPPGQASSLPSPPTGLGGAAPAAQLGLGGEPPMGARAPLGAPPPRNASLGGGLGAMGSGSGGAGLMGPGRLGGLGGTGLSGVSQSMADLRSLQVRGMSRVDCFPASNSVHAARLVTDAHLCFAHA